MPATRGGPAFGPKSVLAFVAGIGVGLALAAPVLGDSLRQGLIALLADGGGVVVGGVVALITVILVLAVLYQSYLSA